MAYEIDIALDLTKQRAKVPRFLMEREVDAKQLNFSILDNGINVDITSQTITFCMKKPDGEIIYNTITISDGANGKCYVVLTSQCQSAVGTAKCWVKLVDGTSVTYSPKFEIEIMAVTDFAAAAESTSEFTDLDADIVQIAGFEGRLTVSEGDIATLEAADGQNVKITGNQTIAGVKTFSSSPVVPAPTADLQAATKKYTDDHAAVVAAAATSGHVKVGTGLAIAAGVLSANGFKVVYATRDVSVEGDQAITGVGFAPRAIMAMAVIQTAAGKMSIGFAAATAAYSVMDYGLVTAGSYALAANPIKIFFGAGVSAQAVVKSWDADGFTFTWSKTGTPTGTVSWMALVMG